MWQSWSGSPLLGSLLILCLGCGDAAAPASESPFPSTPTARSGFIWGQVLDQSGLCLPGAVVEIVAGPGLGKESRQPDGCNAWDYIGYEFSDLPVGATVTIRATAPARQPQDRELVVRNGGEPVQFVLVTE